VLISALIFLLVVCGGKGIQVRWQLYLESGNGVKSGGGDSTLVAGWKRGEGRRAEGQL
jgi:hypothetical protein